MIEIRNACEGDLSRIAGIERENFSLPWDENMLATQLREGYIFLAAVSGDTVLGYVGVQCVLDEGYMSNIAVDKAYRGQGVAGRLMTALHERAVRRGLSFISLEVRPSNAPAIALYEKFGYKEEGRRRNYYEKPREDAVIMTRRWED